MVDLSKIDWDKDTSKIVAKDYKTGEIRAFCFLYEEGEIFVRELESEFLKIIP